MTFDPNKTPGSFSGPPPGAPHETTDGTVPADVTFIDQRTGTVVSAVQMARENERDLPVYAPKPMSDEQAAAYLGKSIDEIRALRAAEVAATPSWVPVTVPAAPAATTPQLVDPSGQPVSSVPPAVAPAPIVAPPGGLRRRIANAPAAPTPLEQLPAASVAVASGVVADDQQARLPVQPAVAQPSSLAEAAKAVHPRGVDRRPAADEPYYPAKSDTDSPSRGMPTAITDKGKQITGGFGDIGEAQYFPMDGREAGLVAVKLLDELRQRIPNDLRFSMALTYSRIRIRAVVEVECYASDGSFMIEKIMVPAHEKTPIDVARQYGDRCCFAVIEQRVEMDDDGQSVTPPNAMRQEIGVQIPRKHAVQMPGGVGRILVDVDSEELR